MDKASRRKADGRGGVLMIVCVAIAALLVLVLIMYLLGERYFRTHYAWGTNVNGISVAGKTEEDVKAEISGQLDNYALLIYERDGQTNTVTEAVSGSEIGLTLIFDDSLEKELAAQSGGKWLWNLGKTREIQISTMVEYDETAWGKKMDALQCFQDEFVTKPQDAYLSEYQDGIGYEIIPEVWGNQPNRKKVTELLSEAVKQLEEEIHLEELDCYRNPAITAEDSSLAKLKAELEKYTNVTITYTFDETKEVLDGNIIKDWLKVDEDDHVTIDADQIAEYVATLRKRYDSIFRPRSFVTTYGDVVSLDSGDYGWWMNYVKEAEELQAMLEAGESGERTPVYYQTAAKYGSQDYGNTYVEVNLTAQHLFFYKDGQLILESDFVSGNASRGLDTPEGVYGITYKERNATLEGENYATPVSYWMPFNGNVGLHDATWRGQFGSKLYRSSGSHGCVNLPYLIARELYSQVEKGTPVICYHLPGTESTSITKQGAEEIAQSAIDAINNIGTVTKSKQCKELIDRARQIYNDLSSAQRRYVDNYQILQEAEKAYRALK